MNKNAVFIPFVILLVAGPAILLGSMSNSKAATEAFKIWGSAAITATEHPFTATNETKMIGFLSPGCQSERTYVGIGNNTWDAAFAAMPADKGIGGTYSGKVTLHIESPEALGPPPPIITDNVAGIVTSVRILIDDIALPSVDTGQTVPGRWAVSQEWDTTTWTEGFHVMCAELTHPDGNLTLMRASMLIVKQTP